MGFIAIKRKIGKYARLGKLLVKDKRVPRISKILLGFAIFYHFTPLDIIPDFIPFFGQLDDIILESIHIGLLSKQ